MKKIKDTKQPTVKQMTSITENLREKFERSSSVQVSCNAFPSPGTIEMEYLVYIDNKTCKTVNSWQEVLLIYHELMEEDFNE